MIRFYFFLFPKVGILGIVLFLSFFTYAGADDIKFFGYFESQISALESKGHFSTVQYNKLRLDVKSKINHKITFGANLNCYNYNGDTAFNILDYIPGSFADTVTPSARDSYVINYEDDIELDNAYIKLAFPFYDVTLGKQQISLGTGYAWNPTDIFNNKDIFDPTYEQPGHNAVRLDMAFNDIYGAEVFYSPTDDFDPSGKLLRLKGKKGHFDYSVILSQAEKFYVLKNTKETRDMYGVDAVGEFLGLGVWTEYAYNDMFSSKDYVEFVCGFDYTFDTGFHFLLEYFNSSEGKDSEDDYTLDDWLGYIYADTNALARDNLFINMSYPVSDLMSLSGSVILNLNDMSSALVPVLNYSLFENIDLEIHGIFYTGDSNSLYHKDLGNGGLVRINFYF